MNDDDERATLLEALETQVASLGHLLANQIPPSWGFALFFFQFSQPSLLTFASNGTRDNVVRMIEEWLERIYGHPLAEELRRVRMELAILQRERNGKDDNP